jgi:ABC-type transport system substrate-binding protein
MAGTVIDTLLDGVAGASTVGVNTGTPVTGGTLTVALTSDAPEVKTFSGQTGKLDAAGFCVANAVFDALFVTNKAGNSYLPQLATGATPDGTNTVWTIDLRQGITFHAGGDFNAAAVVANYEAAKANSTVGLAIKPIIQSVVATGTYEVQYTTYFPYATFPYALAEQQIGFIADPNMFAPTPSDPSTYTWSGGPSGTGPFVFKSWALNVESEWTKNSSYWRQDANGRALPYLAGVNFKTIVDPATRLSALEGGSVQMAVFFDGPSIKSIAKGVKSGGKAVTYVSDQNGPVEPAQNCLLCNVTGTSWLGVVGTQHSNGSWVSSSTPSPIADVRIRTALAHAISTKSYLSGIDSGVGAVSNGIFRTSSSLYTNPNYPAYSVSAAKTLVAAYKTANHLSSSAKVTINMQTLKGSKTATNQFLFVQKAAKAVGITLNSVEVVQSTLIQNAIFKEYELSAWSQFGGVVQDINYVWWSSSRESNDSVAPGFLGGTPYANFVNFANNVDGTVESAMLTALSSTSTAVHKTQWGIVNSQFAKDIPYLWLDNTISVWAATSAVQNWANAGVPATGSSVKSTVQALVPDGGVSAWAQIWLS